jgi:putative endonuclease
MSARLLYVYILTTKRNSALYTGVTNDIERRTGEHKFHLGSKFARRYNVDKLVYVEEYGDSYSAIVREKQLKGGSRAKKIALIESVNSNWNDLSHD